MQYFTLTLILSTSSTYHSVLVYATVTWHIQYQLPNGVKRSENFDFLECYDPSGEAFIVRAGKNTNNSADLHQIRYVERNDVSVKYSASSFPVSNDV